MLQDAYMRGRFKNAPRANVVIGYDLEKAGLKDMTPDQRKEVTDTVAETLMKTPAFAAMGGELMEISAAPVHEHALEARSQMVEEVARFYGLPLPILSAPIGQWTRGVNEQVMKMAWRTGVRPHLDRLLSAFQTRLLMPGERFEVDPTEFVRGDAAGISEMLMATQGDSQRDPVASRPELRRIAGLPRVPDGEIAKTRTEKGDGEGTQPMSE